MRLSIQKKIILVYSVVIIIVFSALNIIAGELMEAGNRETVRVDILSYKENALVYIEQIFIRGASNPTPESFSEAAASLAEEISLMTGRDFAVFDAEGKLLFYSSQNVATEDTADLDLVFEGREAYTTVRSGASVTVYHSFAVTYNDETLGYIRSATDFSDIYAESERVSLTIFYFTLAALAISFALLMVFLRSVISPVKRLTEALAKTRDDPSHIQEITIDRSDEIGELAAEYNRMSLVIKEQIDTIERERDTLKHTLKYRKDFFDNVTHELKTPLTIISGYTELMRENDADADLRRAGLEHISKESDRLKNMVVQLLETSKETSQLTDAATPVELTSVLRSITDSMNIKANRYGDEVVLSAEEGLVVSAVEEKVRQVFINLIDNAIKYGLPNQRITIDARAEAGQATVTVCNKTALIEQKDIERVFVPHYQKSQSENESGSVGLGLSICKDIMIALGGTIDAAMSGNTVTFTVALPLNKESQGVEN